MVVCLEDREGLSARPRQTRMNRCFSGAVGGWPHLGVFMTGGLAAFLAPIHFGRVAKEKLAARVVHGQVCLEDLGQLWRERCAAIGPFAFYPLLLVNQYGAGVEVHIIYADAQQLGTPGSCV